MDAELVDPHRLKAWQCGDQAVLTRLYKLEREFPALVGAALLGQVCQRISEEQLNGRQNASALISDDATDGAGGGLCRCVRAQ